MNPARQQHEVPRFYLERFASKQSGQVECRDLLEQKTYRQLPRELCTLRDGYAVTRDDGTSDHTADEILQLCENSGAAVYDRVIKRQTLNNEERSGFSAFLAAMYVRSPFHLRNMGQVLGNTILTMAQQFAENDDAWKQLEAKQPGRAQDEPGLSEQMRGLFRDGKIDIDITREATIQAINALPKAAEVIHKMNWSIVRTARGALITSDSPLTPTTLPGAPQGFYGHGLTSPFVILTLPLSSSIGWVGHWTKHIPPYEWLSDPKIREFNRFRAVHAERKLFAEPFTQNLEAISKFHKGETKSFRIDGLGSDIKGRVRVVRRLRKPS
jgi:hypothetical protein